jgi:hypothetical protein
MVGGSPSGQRTRIGRVRFDPRQKRLGIRQGLRAVVM